MNSLKYFCCVLVMTFSSSLLAGSQLGEQLDQQQEYKNMEQMFGAIHLEKKQVENMVDKLVESGRINSDEAAKAKREIASMSEADLENLKDKAIAEVKDKRLLNLDH